MTDPTVLHLHHDSATRSVVTPHAQRERGKVIDRGVHIYIYIYMFVDEKNI